MVFAREVRCELCFAVVVAISAPGDADNGRRLDTFGNCQCVHQFPPVFQIGDKTACVREGFADDVCFTAKMFRQCPFAVPEQDLGRRCFAPLLKEAAEQFIVIGIDQRVTAGANCLFGGKLGTGTDREDRFRQYLTLEYFFVQVASQFVNMVFPQVADRRQSAADVAVKGGVADGELGFIGVAGEGTAKGSSQACYDAGAAVA